MHHVVPGKFLRRRRFGFCSWLRLLFSRDFFIGEMLSTYQWYLFRTNCPSQPTHFWSPDKSFIRINKARCNLSFICNSLNFSIKTVKMQLFTLGLISPTLPLSVVRLALCSILEEIYNNFCEILQQVSGELQINNKANQISTPPSKTIVSFCDCLQFSLL